MSTYREKWHEAEDHVGRLRQELSRLREQNGELVKEVARQEDLKERWNRKKNEEIHSLRQLVKRMEKEIWEADERAHNGTRAMSMKNIRLRTLLQEAVDLNSAGCLANESRLELWKGELSAEQTTAHVEE